MVSFQTWCRVTWVGPGGVAIARCLLEGAGTPGLWAVDTVCRLALATSRQGGSIMLTEVSPAMRSLLDLAGLAFEVEGETELGKQALGRQQGQEEAHVSDPPF